MKEGERDARGARGARVGDDIAAAEPGPGFHETPPLLINFDVPVLMRGVKRVVLNRPRADRDSMGKPSGERA